jgi:hypothetical protein
MEHGSKIHNLPNYQHINSTTVSESEELTQVVQAPEANFKNITTQMIVLKNNTPLQTSSLKANSVLENITFPKY